MRKMVFLCLVVLLSPNAFGADLAKGKELFGQRCASCHGSIGAGDGPAAAAFPEGQKPRNFQEATFKYATDDNKFRELLQKGGGSVGLSPLMPPVPDLSVQDLDSLIAYVHTLKK